MLYLCLTQVSIQFIVLFVLHLRVILCSQLATLATFTGNHDMKNSQTQLWLGLVFLRRLGERLARPRIMLVASEQN